ncbi:excinuclease ABC subunit UvrA [Paenibacillus pasadenensis]|uniref:excinuclease ABC subunit UvrA n=1 Tax=Paenibacillus pasadenensis TaxID=217090 RepID=UPI00203BF988|nr:excinuclease ABC subunit UvrA [Paenibacillus pasadenensis]MCM3745755.1 excinuclease ABC subunit UvrA [Paenibacillus pasadenensis]
MIDTIRIRGARENNLKNIDVDIPKHQLIVVTGPSGSGKSTLALDILQRECQRQYLESSGQSGESIPKPKVTSITGLSPAIAVGQHAANRNPRSTVGTATDLQTYLRLVFEKKGIRDCRACGSAMPASAENGAAEIACPACGELHRSLGKADYSYNTPSGACESCSGLGSVVDIDVEAVFDRSKSIRGGAVVFWFESFADYNAAMLEAAGKYYGLPMNTTIPVGEWSEAEWDLLLYGVESPEFARHYPDKPLPKSVGRGRFKGVLTGMWQRYKEKGGQSGEAALFRSRPCTDCGGERLNEISRSITAYGRRLPELTRMSLGELAAWLEQPYAEAISDDDELLASVLQDMKVKVRRIEDVGLGYLMLDRQSLTLSGGEAQRLRLATILGSGLTGVLYLLDEPTTGLHAKDTAGLVQVMKELRDLGNTVLLIEHDVTVMQEADHIIDIGPAAGRFGGNIVGQGSLQELIGQDSSVTGSYFRNPPGMLSSRRAPQNGWITVHEASRHNLQQITATFPLGCLTAVAGVSGSGKSTLVFDLLASAVPGQSSFRGLEGCGNISGMERIDSLITVDQSPLSRMQRSSVSTYMDLFALLRKAYAALPEAKSRKLAEKHFSFNTPGGRCDRCEGLGVVMVDMHFLSHLQITCPECKGKRFKPEVLEVKYEGRSISDFLELSLEESQPLLANNKKMTKLLQLLSEVGLGYLQWGQSVTTLSGGEGQRLKLAKELSAPAKGHTLYLLDEPSSGLHPLDVEKLHLLLSRLVDAGNTVIMVEHNTELIAAADWVLDLGPGGGDAGGELVAAGTPQQLASDKRSVTGASLNLHEPVKAQR